MKNKPLEYLQTVAAILGNGLYKDNYDLFSHSKGPQPAATVIDIPEDAVPIPKGPTKKKLTKAQRKKANLNKTKQLNKVKWKELVKGSTKIKVNLEVDNNE